MGTHRNGLHPEIIDTMPRKIYRAVDHETEEGNPECCPICLADYVGGDELRVLPCDHFMHAQCLDSWLANNPSCPSCRYSLRELVDDRPMQQLRTLRSRLSNSSTLARFLGPDHAEGGIEMTGTFGDSVSLWSLALSEVEAASELRGEDPSGGGDAEDPPIRVTTMDQVGSWRTSRRGLRRERRRSRLAGGHIRSNPRPSRIPTEDLDEER